MLPLNFNTKAADVAAKLSTRNSQQSGTRLFKGRQCGAEDILSKTSAAKRTKLEIWSLCRNRSHKFRSNFKIRNKEKKQKTL